MYGYYPPSIVPQQIAQIPQNIPQNLEARLREMEARLNGIPNNSGYSTQPNNAYMQQAPPAPPQGGNGNQTPSPFISVKSEEEAWRYEVEQWRLMGTKEKFYFYNENTEEIYCKWWDSERPGIVREIYKKSPQLQVEKQVEGVANVPDVSAILDKINSIEEKIDGFAELFFKGGSKRNPKGQFAKEAEVVEE